MKSYLILGMVSLLLVFPACVIDIHSYFYVCIKSFFFFFLVLVSRKSLYQGFMRRSIWAFFMIDRVSDFGGCFVSEIELIDLLNLKLIDCSIWFEERHWFGACC